MLIKSDLSQLESKLYDLTNEVIATTENLELYDMEYVKGSKTLRVYVCNKETKNAVIEDCVEVDRAFTPFVEEADWIPDDFVLEVSSPGVYRNLKTKEHFDAALNENIQVRLKPGQAKKYNSKKTLGGVLEEFNNDKLKISNDDGEMEIAFEDIAKANLDPDTFEGV
tara:strand:- start:46152 stop:46652 length:501 start_codon:yes stop_codon:yes gene_type:complete